MSHHLSAAGHAHPVLRICLLGFLLLTHLPTAHAATIQWTNTAGGLWNGTANWSPNVLPTAADTVVITNDGTYTVGHNVSATVAELVVGGGSGTQTLTIGTLLTVSGDLEIRSKGVVTYGAPSGSLVVQDSATVLPQGHLSMPFGTLRVANSLVVQGSLGLTNGLMYVTNGLDLEGTMTWASGQLNPPTILNIRSNGSLTVPGSGPKTLNTIITNSGTISSTAAAGIGGSGELYNLESGVFEVKSASLLGSGFVGALLINDGILRESASPTYAAIFSATAFTNNGTIDAQVGTISLGGITINEGSQYIGAGTIAIRFGTMNGSFFSENLTLGLAFPTATLNGHGTLHGFMRWAGGTLSSGASLFVAADATLAVSSGYPVTLAGALTNAGSVELTAGYIGLAGPSSSVFHNLPGALLDFQHPAGSGSLGSQLVLINDGVIRKSVGTGLSSIGGMPFINNSIIEAQSGSFILVDVTLAEGSSYIGPGTNYLFDEATLAGSFTSENLVGAGNAVYMQGTGTLHGSMEFPVNFTLQPGANLTVASNSVLITRTNFHVLGNLTNSGAVEIHAGIRVDGIVDNTASGLVDMRNPWPWTGDGAGQFLNNGLFRKSTGIGPNDIPAEWDFLNNGTVLATSGTIRFGAAPLNPSGTLAVAGGRISSATPLELPGGHISGWGTVEAPSITSAAVVSPGATNAVLTLSGSYTQQLGGTMEFHLDGTDAGTSHSQVIVTGNAHLNGSLVLHYPKGYSPGVGASHEVLRAGSLSGDFKCHNGLLFLGDDKRLVATYSPTNLLLTAMAAPDPSGPSLSIAKEEQSLICWPTEFIGYGLYTNATLEADLWAEVPDVTNRYFDASLDPAKFFKLIKQP